MEISFLFQVLVMFICSTYNLQENSISWCMFVMSFIVWDLLHTWVQLQNKYVIPVSFCVFTQSSLNTRSWNKILFWKNGANMTSFCSCLLKLVSNSCLVCDYVWIDMNLFHLRCFAIETSTIISRRHNQSC